MTPVQPDVIRRKLDAIARNLEALAPIATLSLEAYRADLFRRKGTERLLQEIIEAAIDVNAHVLVETGGSAPDDYFQSFTRMSDIGILGPDLARRLAPSAGLRNRLVHEYDQIDDALILKALSEAQGDYALYVKAIEDYLRR